jgi:hypothetical protein
MEEEQIKTFLSKYSPQSGGKICFVDFQGNYLVSEDKNFAKLYDNFKLGKRTNIKTLEDIKQEVEELFSV